MDQVSISRLTRWFARRFRRSPGAAVVHPHSAGPLDAPRADPSGSWFGICASPRMKLTIVLLIWADAAVLLSLGLTHLFSALTPPPDRITLTRSGLHAPNRSRIRRSAPGVLPVQEEGRAIEGRQPPGQDPLRHEDVQQRGSRPLRLPIRIPAVPAAEEQPGPPAGVPREAEQWHGGPVRILVLEAVQLLQHIRGVVSMNHNKSTLTGALAVTAVALVLVGAYGWGMGTNNNSSVVSTVLNADAPAVSILTSTTSSLSLSCGAQGNCVGIGGVSGGGGGGIIVTQTTATGRVQAIAQGVAGTIDYGQFEHVSGEVLIMTASLGGYVSTSESTLTNGLWYGTWVINVPSNESQTSLFNYTSLVNSYGKVTSVDVKTNDVTTLTHGNSSAVPYAPLSLQLQEVAAKVPAQTGFQAASSQLVSVLSTIGTGALFYGALALPVFGLSLALIYAGRRVFYPLLMRAYKEKRRGE